MREQTVFLAHDDTPFSTAFECKQHEAKLAGKTYICPACEGKATEHGDDIVESREDEDATAWGGQFASPVYRDVVVGHKVVPCSVCDGYGWTDHQKIPVTKQVRTGWADVQS